MTGTQIITNFERQVDDITELSTAEELTLANRIWYRICRDRPWEFLKTNVTGSIVLDAVTGLYYITLPSNFGFLCSNANYTENFMENQSGKAPVVIFVGTNYTPYQVINFSDRRQYRTKSGFCYVDVAGGKIWFTGNTAPVALTYDFDYCKVPAAITASTGPVVPANFEQPMGDAIMYGMATENDVLQLSDKAKSYLKENNALYQASMLDMQYINANLQMN